MSGLPSGLEVQKLKQLQLTSPPSFNDASAAVVSQQTVDLQIIPIYVS